MTARDSISSGAVYLFAGIPGSPPPVTDRLRVEYLDDTLRVRVTLMGADREPLGTDMVGLADFLAAVDARYLVHLPSESLRLPSERI